MIRVCCLSDLHGYLPPVPECDVLAIAGDIVSLDVQRHVDGSARWFDTSFRKWLTPLSERCKVVAVAGNHDFVFEREPGKVPADLPWTYLQDSGAEVLGLKFWGAPWQPTFHDWAFNLDEVDLRERWALIPEGTDVLVVHGPPYGLGDTTWAIDRNLGSYTLRERVDELKPRLVVCGHIHGGAGLYRCGPTTVVNASVLDEQYRLTYNRPYVVELEAR